jgi:hypothetical protein
MTRYILLIAVLCGMNFLSVAADEQALKPENVLEACFTQQRHLSMIPKAIKSEGRMILWQGHGLIWSTSTPFPNTILISKSGLFQIEDGIKTPMVKAGGDSAMFDVMAGIFNISDESSLKGFTVEKLPSGDSIKKLRLIPQHSQVQQFIQSIVLEGNVQITHVTIYRPNGDRDEIEIKSHSIKESPTPQIMELFDD